MLASPSPGSCYEGITGGLGESGNHGKFMINQRVLRGGCCVTPQSHLRVTYRNFFYPHDRWPSPASACLGTRRSAPVEVNRRCQRRIRTGRRLRRGRYLLILVILDGRPMERVGRWAVAELLGALAAVEVVHQVELARAGTAAEVKNPARLVAVALRERRTV